MVSIVAFFILLISLIRRFFLAALLLFGSLIGSCPSMSMSLMLTEERKPLASFAVHVCPFRVSFIPPDPPQSLNQRERELRVYTNFFFWKGRENEKVRWSLFLFFLWEVVVVVYVLSR